MPVAKKAAQAAAPVVEGEVVTSTDTEEATFEATIGGRKIRMAYATGDQFAALARVAKRAEKDPSQMGYVLEVFFGLVEKLLVDKDDIKVLDELLIEKSATVADITKALEAEPDADGGEKSAPRRTRRGR